MQLSVIPFSAADHLRETSEVLLRVRQADPTYPPPQDLDSDADADAFAHWLMDMAELGRWVALADGHVVGHVLVREPHAYLTDHLAELGRAPQGARGFAEIAKLFVDPGAGRRGVGAALLGCARAFATDAGLEPTLAVVVTSQGALGLYAREGMQDVGGFLGIHGENRVFVSPPVAPHPDR